MSIARPGCAFGEAGLRLCKVVGLADTGGLLTGNDRPDDDLEYPEGVGASPYRTAVGLIKLGLSGFVGATLALEGTGCSSTVGFRNVAGLAATEGFSLLAMGDPVTPPEGGLRLSYLDTMSLIEPFLWCRGRSALGIDKPPFDEADSESPVGDDKRSTFEREEEEGGKLYIDTGLALAFSDLELVRPLLNGFGFVGEGGLLDRV